MRREISGVRILPMSDKAKGFVGRSIDDVQRKLFLRDLPARAGRFRYRSTGLNARPGTIVLFQYRAHVIASAVFIRDEKFRRPIGGHGGALHVEPASIRTFEPVDAATMRKVWPAFRTFGHVKQFLNPARYPMFKRRLKRVEAPPARPRQEPTQPSAESPHPPTAQPSPPANTPKARK
jgi:hypothetical protein